MPWWEGASRHLLWPGRAIVMQLMLRESQTTDVIQVGDCSARQGGIRLR